MSAALLRLHSRMPAVASLVLLALCVALLSATAHATVKSVTKASFFYLPEPRGVAVDAAGNVYGLVSFNGSIVKWTAAGKLLSTTTPLPSNSLEGLAVDGCGSVYIGSAHLDVFIVNAAGQLSQLQTPPAASSLHSVPYIWEDAGSGRIYAADNTNNRVVVFDHNGLVLSYIATANIYDPIAVAADSAGNLFVLNSYSASVSKLDSTGATLLHSYSTSNPSLSDPFGLAVDSADNVYVADQGNNRVVQFSKAGVFTTVFTVPVSPLGNGMSQVAVDACGAVYVTDNYHQRIVKWVVSSTCTYKATVPAYCSAPSPFTYFSMPSPSGVSVDAAGSVHGLNGQQGSLITFSQSAAINAIAFPSIRGGSLSLDACGTAYVGSEETVIQLQTSGAAVPFNVPGGANAEQIIIQPGQPYVDSNGSVYIPDSHNDAVFVLSAQGLLVSILQLRNVVNSPLAVARDSAGSLYVVANNSSNVYKLSVDGSTVLLVFNTSNTPLSNPSGIVVDSRGNVFVSDTGNSRIVEFNPRGGVARILVTPSPFLGQTGQLALDTCGNVYVVDPDNSRIVKFRLNTTCTLPTVGPAPPAYCSALSPFAFYYMPNVAGVAVDPSGVLHGLNGGDGSVVAFTASGARQVSYTFGPIQPDLYYRVPSSLTIDACGQQYCLGNRQLLKANGSVVSEVQLPAAEYTLNEPTSVWADLDGTVYVSQGGDDRGAYPGSRSIVHFDAFGAPLEFVSLNDPYRRPAFGVATDGYGNIYTITSGGREVVVLGSTGHFTLAAYNDPINGAVAVAVDRSGNVFVLDSDSAYFGDYHSGGSGRVLQLNSTGYVVATFYTPYPYLGATTQMALDACGNVYVADPVNGRIVEFILHPGCSNAALATAVPAACTAPPAYVYYPMPSPTGVAVDRSGNVYGLDGSNGGIVQFSVSGGVSAAYPLTAFPDSTNGLTIDGCGQQYVSDDSNDVLWKVNSSSVMQFGLSNGASFLSSPGPSWVDSNGFVYLADIGNQTIVKFNQAGRPVDVFFPSGDGPLVAVATDSAGDIFAAFESYTVTELSATGAYESSLELFDKATPSPVYVPNDLQFLQAGGLAIDRYNDIYVSDQANDYVVQYKSGGGFVATFFTPPPYISDPTQVTVDLCGNIYVVDPGNNRIVQFVTNLGCIVAQQPFTAPSYCPHPAPARSSSSSTAGARSHVSSSSSTKGK